MPPKVPRNYWDAAVVLSLFDSGKTAEKAEQRRIATLLAEDAERGNALIVTSTLTVTEARRGEGNPPLPGENYATPRAFLRNSFIEVVPLDRGTAELAADYADRFGLKNHDAIQLATAVRAKADVFLAWNGDFHRKEKMKDPPIRIEKPTWTGARQLTLEQTAAAAPEAPAPPPAAETGPPPATEAVAATKPPREAPQVPPPPSAAGDVAAATASNAIAEAEDEREPNSSHEPAQDAAQGHPPQPRPPV